MKIHVDSVDMQLGCGGQTRRRASIALVCAWHGVHGFPKPLSFAWAGEGDSAERGGVAALALLPAACASFDWRHLLGKSG